MDTLINYNLQRSAWYQGLTLLERRDSLRAVQYGPSNTALSPDRADIGLQRWRSQKPFGNNTVFAQRLATDQLQEDELRFLLGESSESLHSRVSAPPPWLTQLTQAYRRPPTQESPRLPLTYREQPMAGLLEIIRPLINQGRHRVRRGIRKLARTASVLPFDIETVTELFSAGLSTRLLQRVGRTMVLELQVARLQGRLQGETSQERFDNFVRNLGDRDFALAILAEYPVLAAQVVLCINQWIAATLEFLHRLCGDWAAIRGTFCRHGDPGLLIGLSADAGDKHCGGRSVLVARFSSGFQIVYKPRSLAVDTHFQELLRWINKRGDHPPFRALEVLECTGYGWVEFVAAHGCTSRDDVIRFYERQGGYLAMLYALEAADFHHENLIAAGEHPMLLDLEALFQPRIQGRDARHAEEIAGSALFYSVLGVGLLPVRVWTNADGEGIDLSGLGGPAGQLTPYGVPLWDGAGTDEVRIKRERLLHPGAQNRPFLNGIEVDPVAYSDSIVNGFTAIYRLLQKHRHELLSEHGPIARFAGDEVRVILRNTRTYSMLQYESFHPDVLRNALDRERLLDRLWGRVEQFPYLAQVIPAERQDLQNGDIPLFTTCPESRDLRTSSQTRIRNFFDEPSINFVKRRVWQLGDGDLRQQLWIVQASLATISRSSDRVLQPTYGLVHTRTTADYGRLITAASAVGDRLQEMAVRGDDDVSWIGLTLTNDQHWSLMPLGMDFYDGIPGVVIFLAYLAHITREDRYRSLAKAALRTLRRQMERGGEFLTSIGGFDGWGGLIYTLTHLALLWNEPMLLAEAKTIVDRISSLIARDEKLDVISGSAGCIGSLVSLYRCAPADNILAAAIQCGERLITTAQHMKKGMGWIVPSAGTKPLTGFSHGSAGIGWALLELAALTGHKRFRMTAHAAIAYERSLFSQEMENWPDLRNLQTGMQADKESEQAFPSAWCHGAPGIGLARLSSLRHFDDAETRAEIRMAIKTTLAHGFGLNHSLCHGDLGNLELLMQSGKSFDDNRLRLKANQLAAMILDSIQRDGWLCPNPLGVESPGLMTGLAGIGYGLLRLAEPARVPSVLMLEPCL